MTADMLSAAEQTAKDAICLPCDEAKAKADAAVKAKPKSAWRVAHDQKLAEKKAAQEKALADASAAKQA